MRIITYYRQCEADTRKSTPITVKHEQSVESMFQMRYDWLLAGMVSLCAGVEGYTGYQPLNF